MRASIRFGLGIAGFTEADIAEIDKAIPAVERLLALVEKHKPDLQEAYGDLLATIPAAKIVVGYLKKE